MVLDAMRVSYELFDLCDSRDCNKKEKYKEVCASKRNGQLWFPQIFFGEDYCGNTEEADVYVLMYIIQFHFRADSRFQDYDDFAEAIESNKLNTFLKLAPAETSAINEQEVGVKNVGEDDEARDSDKPSATTASNGHDDDDDDGDVVDEETENKVEEDSENLQKSTHEVSADDSDANFDRGVSSEALEEEVNNKESDKLENTTDENDDENDESKSGMRSSVENSSDNECSLLKEEHVDEKSIQGEEEEEEEKEEGEEEEPEENEEEEEEKKDDDEEEDSEQQQEQEEVNDKAEKEAEKEELDNITEEEEEAEDELEVEDDEERSDSE
ncbi:hypothetical protein T02_8755 [Trichinella nativa]|uniref:Uncharacterized protein n=1 Tax=Trichinella nativa TaxID=6335 RepID=A0A0V1KTZ3_9BILA|nr:hypothetical protein T02_8755 [Trichinella nativa]